MLPTTFPPSFSFPLWGIFQEGAPFSNIREREREIYFKSHFSLWEHKEVGSWTPTVGASVTHLVLDEEVDSITVQSSISKSVR